MSDEVKHTPIPWKGWHGDNSLDITPENDKEFLIASLPECSISHWNMRCILEAVNNHDRLSQENRELREALETITRIVCEERGTRHSITERMMIRAAQDALAKSGDHRE